MEYILKDGGIQLGNYLKYLESIRALLPPHVAAFAADARHYTLDDHESLHDAWIETVVVREPSSGSRQEVRETVIEVHLLGSYHDRVHVLTYRGVRAYQLQGIDVGRGHGDVYTHETRLTKDRSALVHEYAFADGSEHESSFLSIECEDFTHEMRELPLRAG